MTSLQECFAGPAALTPTEQLDQRHQEVREKAIAEHNRLIQAEHANVAERRRKALLALENEDDETKAQRATMAACSRRAASQPPPRATADGPTDKRSRRIEHAAIYTAGVEAFRARSAREESATVLVSDAASRSSDARVLVRARPLFAHEAERGEWDSVSALPRCLGGGVVIHESAEKLVARQGMVHVLRHHSFAAVSTVRSDDELYAAVCHLPRRAANGGIATMFCYGMTGSGKTYSMDGVHRRLPVDLFDILGGNGATVHFSAYELLGKRCFELLPEGRGEEEGGKREVFLRVDGEGETQVRGVAQHAARDPEALLALLRAAALRRETSATGSNATSSRSHAVYALALPGGGRLNLIDLAGSEGSQESLFHTAKHVAEAKEINKSLAVLRACLQARSTVGTTAHAPYREAVLTRVLEKAISDPSSATVLLACVSPCCTHLEHSLRTLRTALHLTGGEGGSVEEEVLRVPSVRSGGPKRWDADALRAWLEEKGLASSVQLPPAMDGKALMKASKLRLRPYCGGDAAVAERLFDGLRLASKEAARRELEARRRIKGQGPEVRRARLLGGAAGFARNAPANPRVTGERIEE